MQQTQKIRVPSISSTVGVHAELGRFPLLVNIQQAMIKYWFRIISRPEDRLAAHCYWSILELNPTNDPWLNTIQNIINSTGLHFLWNTQKSLSTQNPWVLFKYESYICRTLQDVSLQHANEKINSETKLSYLKNCKTSNKISAYLGMLNIRMLNSRAKRSSFCQLRLGTLDLEIEKGRGRDIPHLERYCKICNSHEVEN